MGQKTILVITDGIGFNSNNNFNAFSAAKKPTFDWLFKNTANTLIKTSGLAVGLPEGQMGNSEVGHMSIGSGRIIYQNLVKIDLAIKNREFEQNTDLNDMFKKCKNIHIIGLYSDGGVHSHLNHFNSIYELAKQNGCNTFAHIITDGRDVSPKSAFDFIKNAENKMNIASISGRFYTMDRDNRFERVKLAYDAYFAKLKPLKIKPSEYINQRYNENEFDEFITPATFNEFDGIKQEDGVIFINFRNDRMKELVATFGCEEFKEFSRDFFIKNIITMTEYDSKFSFPTLIKKEILKNTLSEVIANAGLRQFHTAETEKYAHVTFFFNGGVEDMVKNETRVLVPSPKVKTYDEKPEMSAYEVCDAVLNAMDNEFDFIVVNFANGDMVGHTGNYEAAVKSVEAIDECLGKIIEKAKQKDYAYIQTSDHGNCEEMCDKNGEMLTNHTTFDVFCFIMAKDVKILKQNFGLSNIAPSVLKLIGLEIPDEMNEALF
ncbi:phosphoglycerate mutase (2,3-diphosphoglycerate-independent) [Campylobacter pinnipediorum subsp. pinnipediorum]|uniref:2,3-bisphosphoglycerate-independent phosphoglycerate mutase n=1 Tax=Campylobacter pinnipediorum subsp. pinnipediorum TaxID=1660067 RepID=A0AAX0L9A8_9BACT|nr:2,3-bisphosphoglycerate-independent phosphoglycerate mutase [Campylobacter pinnipediorum]OPA75018.1 phosphoglycerate mutase (2,3-diphosphoglycerate-independent) [Campylobacter pinnipediorum subsp. pinnipediorum]